jgi:hypothetical protein
VQSAVDVDEVDAHLPAADPGYHRTHGPGSATASANHLAEVVGMHPDLQHATTSQLPVGNRDVVRMLDDAPHEVLESLLEHLAPRRLVGAGRGWLRGRVRGWLRRALGDSLHRRGRSGRG